VTLPTVPAEYFSILLTGMHSGTFALTNENVYQVKIIKFTKYINPNTRKERKKERKKEITKKQINMLCFAGLTLCSTATNSSSNRSMQIVHRFESF
jgi:hypothetical protein